MKRMVRYLFAAALAPFLLLISCGENREIIPSAEFAPYVSAYTGGVITPSSTIRIEFAQPVEGIAENTPAESKLFKFKPSVKGSAVWINNRTIEFVPEEGALRTGILYNGFFALGKVMDVPSKLRSFGFSFRVQEPGYSMDVHPCSISEEDPRLVDIAGEIRTSQFTETEKVASMLSLEGSRAQPSVTADEAGTTFRFEFNGIERAAEQKTLTLTAHGRKAGYREDISQTVVVPALGVFEVMDAQLLREGDPSIEISFTDLLESGQDLRGLVVLSGAGDYRLAVNGSKINLYLGSTAVGTAELTISENVRNIEGKNLPREYSFTFELETPKPQVKMLSSGSILPDSKNLTIPFRAVNLSAVDVRVIRIYESNVMMFLQVNQLAGSQELRRAGRPVLKKTVRLDADPTRKLNSWNDYSLDIGELIAQEPGAIYRIEMSFKKEYSLYDCGTNEGGESNPGEGMQRMAKPADDDEDTSWDEPRYYYYDDDYGDMDWDLYRWRDRDDPCTPSYYMVSDRKASCNAVASNLGLIVKRSDDKQLWTVVNDLLTTAPVKEAQVKAYNFQLQEIGSATTDKDGFAYIATKGIPFLVTAQHGAQKTYLRVPAGEEKSTTRFDVGGKEIAKGLKGFIYGERGVWRPGDTIHLGFILEDRERKIPADHPVTLEVYNPRGQFAVKMTSTSGQGGFYRFDVATSPDDETGLWNAYVKVGGASFHKSLRVETVKPNRLKINLTLPKRIDASKGSVQAKLSSAWLTGATAHGLDVKVDMLLKQVNTAFDAWKGYVFSNPASDFSSTEMGVYSGKLDDNGNADIAIRVPEAKGAPGMLRADVVCRVFEPGGDASISTQSVPFSPYDTYVGLNVGKKSNEYFETGVDNKFSVVTVDADGKTVDRNGLEYKIYRLSWSWWWERNDESLDSYVGSGRVQPVKTGKLNTRGGKATIDFKLEYPGWGRYLVYVKDPAGGHATGQIVYIDWPSWYGRSDKADPSGATMLTFSTDRTDYESGDEATVIIPSSGGSGARALISLENGSKVLAQHWVECEKKGDTKYKFRITDDMAPNFYIHVSLLQPHAQTSNNLPIRMYGVVPVAVNSKRSHLTPTIEMEDVLRPQQPFTVKVREEGGRPMTYTLAIVDDGLLDLTNFKTPDPWKEFYAREALGVRTWDMYDEVIGAFGGRFGSLLGIGGDEDLKPDGQKANRFKPVVMYLGPFTIGKGGSQSHKVTLPMYVGSVRVMVVAGGEGAYGCAEKTVPVRNPLMILPTLPRVLSVGEDIVLPVNVFAMEASVRNVTVKVAASGLAKVAGSSSQSLSFAAVGDKMAYFALKVGDVVGVEKITITASGGGHSASEVIDIAVRNPNPPVYGLVDTLIRSGGEVTLTAPTGDMRGGWARLDATRMPSMDISRRFNYLEDYTHCCTEQLTSKGYPLLFAPLVRELTATESEMVKKNVKEAISMLYARQLPSGGFVYWPGWSQPDMWVTSYAGSFLVEAKERGYEVNQAVIDRWKSFQSKAAREWRRSAENSSGYRYYFDDLEQAYRLYTLALAGSPEQGAMNRMRESSDLTVGAKWRLAAAYAIGGKAKMASEMVWNIKTDTGLDPKAYNTVNYIYGSPDRDQAMILEALVLTGDMQGAMKLAKQVSYNLTHQSYFSTQSTAFSLIAMGRLASKLAGGSIEMEWKVDGKGQKTIQTSKSSAQADVPTKGRGESIALRNTGAADLYVTLTSKIVPLVDNQPARANNLKIEVAYRNTAGAAIDPGSIAQGSDFTVAVRVTNTSGYADYNDLALTQIFPSGWEVFNERMASVVEDVSRGKHYNYQDIRDDRVMTYFTLARGETKAFTVRLQASYEGTFILPAVICESMYEPATNARTTAGVAKVIKN